MRYKVQAKIRCTCLACGQASNHTCKCTADQNLSVAKVETNLRGGVEQEGVHLSSLRTDTPRKSKMQRSETKTDETSVKLSALRDNTQQAGGKLSHAASNVFKIMVFVRFKSSSPTVFKGKPDRVRCFLNGGEPSELNILRFELIYVTLGWPFAYSSAREVPILHMLPQRGFRGVVSRKLEEGSTHIFFFLRFGRFALGSVLRIA